MEPKKYDSTYDTMAHKKYLYDIITIIIIQELFHRAEVHDDSKLIEPEKSLYDKYIPELQKVKYGTQEYYDIKREMKDNGSGHHLKVNRHHPEHFQNGINGMNIIDFVEMISDWFAASLRSDTPFDCGGLDNNIKKFNIPPMLENIIRNTYNDYFKNFESLVKGNDIEKLDGYVKDLKFNICENREKGLYDKELADYLLESIYSHFLEKINKL